MFSTFHLGHYQPLSWLTLALDYLIWGMNPFGYHLTNLVLHAALQIEPESAEAHQSLAIALSEQGRRDEAMRHYHEAVRIRTSERLVRIGSSHEKANSDRAGE